MDRDLEDVSCIVPGFVYREVSRRQCKSDAMNQRYEGKLRIFYEMCLFAIMHTLTLSEDGALTPPWRA